MDALLNEPQLKADYTLNRLNARGSMRHIDELNYSCVGRDCEFEDLEVIDGHLLVFLEMGTSVVCSSPLQAPNAMHLLGYGSIDQFSHTIRKLLKSESVQRKERRYIRNLCDCVKVHQKICLKNGHAVTISAWYPWLNRYHLQKFLITLSPLRKKSTEDSSERKDDMEWYFQLNQLQSTFAVAG